MEKKTARRIPATGTVTSISINCSGLPGTCGTLEVWASHVSTVSMTTAHCGLVAVAVDLVVAVVSVVLAAVICVVVALVVAINTIFFLLCFCCCCSS